MIVSSTNLINIPLRKFYKKLSQMLATNPLKMSNFNKKNIKYQRTEVDLKSKKISFQRKKKTFHLFISIKLDVNPLIICINNFFYLSNLFSILTKLVN